MLNTLPPRTGTTPPAHSPTTQAGADPRPALSDRAEAVQHLAACVTTLHALVGDGSELSSIRLSDSARERLRAIGITARCYTDVARSIAEAAHDSGMHPDSFDLAWNAEITKATMIAIGDQAQRALEAEDRVSGANYAEAVFLLAEGLYDRISLLGRARVPADVASELRSIATDLDAYVQDGGTLFGDGQADEAAVRGLGERATRYVMRLQQMARTHDEAGADPHVLHELYTVEALAASMAALAMGAPAGVDAIGALIVLSEHLRRYVDRICPPAPVHVRQFAGRTT